MDATEPVEMTTTGCPALRLLHSNPLPRDLANEKADIIAQQIFERTSIELHRNRDWEQFNMPEQASMLVRTK